MSSCWSANTGTSLSLTSLPLLLQLCPTCLVRLIWVVLEMGCTWSSTAVSWIAASRIYSIWLVAIIFSSRQVFSISVLSAFMWCIHIIVWTRPLLGKNPLLVRSCLLFFKRYIYIYIYIVIPKQTVSLYHNSSVWLDMQAASSRNRNPADFTYIYIYIYIYMKLAKTNFYLFIYFFFFCFYMCFSYLKVFQGILRIIVRICILLLNKFQSRLLMIRKKYSKNRHAAKFTYIYIYIYIYWKFAKTKFLFALFLFLHVF